MLKAKCGVYEQSYHRFIENSVRVYLNWFPFFSSYRTTDYMLIAKCGVVMNSLTIVSLKTVFVYI